MTTAKVTVLPVLALHTRGIVQHVPFVAGVFLSALCLKVYQDVACSSNCFLTAI